MDELAEYRARVVAALDQAVTSAEVDGDAGEPRVSIGAREWRRLQDVIAPRPRRGPGEFRVPKGEAAGWTLNQVAALGAKGWAWIEWARSRPDGAWPEWFALVLEEFVARHERRAA